MITIFAPEGIGEITAASDLAADIHTAIRDDPQSGTGPQAGTGLRAGDVVVVTSKIISKHEGRFAPATRRLAEIDAETVRTVARRRTMAIVETPHGLTQAAAGVDNSNVTPGTILLLPKDSDATAEVLRQRLSELSGVPVGVIVSDTAGRAWRIGQTDHAIGAAGVRVIDSYDGRTDGYGNDLHVTEVAIADELASAADLVKRKLAGRPVAVIRGLAEFVLDPPVPDPAPNPVTARDLLRPGAEDLFRMGVREAVLHSLLVAVGRPERYEAVVRLEDPAELQAAITGGADLDAGQLELIQRMLAPLAVD